MNTGDILKWCIADTAANVPGQNNAPGSEASKCYINYVFSRVTALVDGALSLK